MRIIVAIAIVAVVSGCAPFRPQVYYSSYPDYLPPNPEVYGDPYFGSPPSPELYGDPYPYGYG